MTSQEIRLVKTYVANTQDKLSENFYLITMDKFSNGIYRIISSRNGEFLSMTIYSDEDAATFSYHAIQQTLLGKVVNNIRDYKNGGWRGSSA